MVKSEGRICYPTDAEFRGIDSALDYIISNSNVMKNKMIFAGIDS